MKFTCDSCGAQYMIGDEKLGKRGVKVRCKKCQYVIILRPTGYQPSEKKSSDEPSTGDMTPSFEGRVTIPPDAMGPTTPFNTPHFATQEDDDVLAATSSDMGLSKEFAAMGFDEGAAKPHAKTKSLSVNLDVAKIEPSFPDTSSPFSLGATGGSLDDARDGLASALPRIQRHDDDSDEQTSVDKTPLAARALDFGDEDDSFDSTAPGHDAAPKLSLGSAEPAKEAFDENADNEQMTRRLSYDGAKKEQKPVSISFDDDNLSDKLRALEKNELQDMHASLNQSLSVDTPHNMSGKAQKQPPAAPARGSSSVYEPKPTKPNHATLNALAAAAAGDAPSGRLPSFISPAVAAAAPVAPMAHGPVHSASAPIAHSNGDAMHDGPVLDNELQGAFDAMFSPSAAPGPAFQEGNLAANTVQESAPAELFRSAYANNSDADRRPTRIFDIEAMQQVQAEQDLASRPVSVTNGKRKTDEPEWYVAINDEQVGPFTFAEVRARWDANELAPASLCWKQGMADWTAIKNVKELESLGEMDDKARTVVQRVEPNDEAEEHQDEPPTIAHPEDDPRRQDVRATDPGKEDTEDEPSWRPSAASALASLAAAELNSDSSSASSLNDKRDVAVGRALPATSDALEKLLAGDSKAAASSPFGAGEMSSSSIRPLPKRMDVTSSVSLRDPVLPLARQKSYMVPAAIIGGFLFLGVIVAVVLTRTPAQPTLPQQQVVAALPGMQQQTGLPVQPQQQQVVQPAQAVAEQPAQPVQPAQVAEVKQPDTTQAAAVVEKKEEPVKTELAKGEPKETKEPRESRGTKKAPAREKQERESKEERPKKEEKKEKEELAVVERPAMSEEDELLGGAPKKKKLPVAEVSNDLPDQLDDAQILGELRKHKTAIQNCRTKQANANPGLEGTMTVTFVIEGNGRTKRWDVQPSNFKSSVVGKCVIDSVKTWSFPKFSGRSMPVDFPVRVGGK